MSIPIGIVLGHNGNLTNSEALKQEMFRQDLRHINTQLRFGGVAECARARTGTRCKGSEARPGDHIYRGGERASTLPRCLRRSSHDRRYGLLAFRDPFGIRPLVFGRNNTSEGPEYLVASESVALTAFGFELVRDVARERRSSSKKAEPSTAVSAPRSRCLRPASSNTSTSPGPIP